MMKIGTHETHVTIRVRLSVYHLFIAPRQRNMSTAVAVMCTTPYDAEPFPQIGSQTRSKMRSRPRRGPPTVMGEQSVYLLLENTYLKTLSLPAGKPVEMWQLYLLAPTGPDTPQSHVHLTRQSTGERLSLRALTDTVELHDHEVICVEVRPSYEF
jgi:hypothetical protein